jgi:hypothetical protein
MFGGAFRGYHREKSPFGGITEGTWKVVWRTFQWSWKCVRRSLGVSGGVAGGLGSVAGRLEVSLWVYWGDVSMVHRADSRQMLLMF